MITRSRQAAFFIVWRTPVHCQSCGSQIDDAPSATSAGSKPRAGYAARDLGDRVKASSLDALDVLKQRLLNPVGGLSAAFASLGTNRALSSPVVNRYRDAYRIGAALVGLGSAIKVVGANSGRDHFLGSLSSASGPWRGGAVVAGIFAAAIVGALFWVCGVIVAAQGQILPATLDNAVGHSPFLSDRERLDARLPRSIAGQAAGT